jgi:iron complex outermembrane receptor protein
VFPVLPLLWLLVTAVCPGPSFAGEEEAAEGKSGDQEPAYEIESTVVRAVRIREARDDPSAFASVVETETYKGHFRTLPDLISRQPGVNLRQYGGLGQLSTVSIRGSSAEQVLVLLDGIPLNTGEGGSVDMSTIPLDALERFEVVRGGGNTVYGPNAMGGVVNLVSKSSDGRPESSALFSYGSWDTLKGAATTRGTVKGVDYLLSGTYLQSDGDFTFETSEVIVGDQVIQPSEEKTRINNDFASFDLLTRAGFSPWERLKIDLSNEFFNTDRGQPGFEENQQPFARQKHLRNTTYLRFVNPNTFGDWSRTKATAFFGYNRIHFTNPEPITNPIDTLSKDYVFGGDAEIEMYGTFLASDHLGRIGMTAQGEELRDEVLEGQEGYGDPGRIIVSGFLQDEIVLPGDRISLLLAGRLEYSDEEGTNPTGKVGLVWRCLERAYVKANLENVFRLPTFRELYYPDQGWIRGNPDLDPERGVNVDFGFGINFPRMFFETAGFHNDVKDTILWLPVSPFTIQPVNTGDVEMWGAEVDWEARPWDFLSLMVNYLFLDAQVQETGEQMPGRPRHTVNARGSFEGLYGDIYAELQYMSAIPVTASGEVMLGWRTVVDLGARLNLLALPGLRGLRALESFSVGLDVKNVGDVSVKDVRGLPLPGRGFFGTIQATF